MANMYDIVIVGGGPGGYSAALYAARAGLHVVVLEKQRIGGQAVHSENIENYPGFDAGIDGLSLSEKMQRGAERFGAEMVTDEVRRVQLMQPVKVVETTKQRLPSFWRPAHRRKSLVYRERRKCWDAAFTITPLAAP